MKKEIYIISLLFVFLLAGCQGGGRAPGQQDNAADSLDVQPETINKVTFYIENSESMFGYVNSNTEFVSVLTELAQKSDMVRTNTAYDFNFINGRQPQITHIGNDPGRLAALLNRDGFRKGDVTNSNLNAMFERALTSAGGDSISILISDGIYDVGKQSDPLNALINEGKGLRTRFIQRLMKENLQTLLVQFTSRFKGDYFPGMGGVIKDIDQERPYYIWIFGNSDLLTKYFSEQYLRNLDGYNNMARFFVVKDFNIPYEVVAHNTLGTYRTDRRRSHLLTGISTDRNTKEFQFSIATSYGEVPYPESYFTDADNYTSSPNYEVTEVSTADQLSGLLFKALPFEPTHLITVKANGNPAGDLQVNLQYAFPGWIENSTTENDRSNPVDTGTTFGLKHLTQAIREAYADVSGKENIASFRITIQN
jgi:hypothetical protein